jgi:hypothetical protein
MKCGTKAKKYADGGEVSDKEKRMREQMLQEVADEKARKAAEDAYNASLTSPETVNPPKQGKPAAKKAMGGMVKGYATGGMVKTRGMGAATRGGKCKMY